MIVAVLQQRCGSTCTNQDVFASTVGGVRIQEPAGDLATAIAIASAGKVREVPTDVVAIGEIGLAGELRRVRDTPQRIAEAARLGFGSAIVPLEHGGRPGPCAPSTAWRWSGVPTSTPPCGSSTSPAATACRCSSRGSGPDLPPALDVV